MTTALTGEMTVSLQILINTAQLRLLDGSERLGKVRQLHVEDYVGRIQQHIIACLIV